MTQLTVVSWALGLGFLVTLVALAWRCWAPAQNDAGEDLGQPTRGAFPTEFIEIERWRWRVHRSGRGGPAVLLLHGLGANLFCWRGLAPLLDQNFTLIAPDLPGFGQTTILDDEAYGLDDQIPRLIALLDHLRFERCHVVGNSMGGNLALWLAVGHPDRVRSVAVIAPAVDPRLIPPGLAFAGWFAHPLALLASRRTVAWIHNRVVSRPNLIDLERIEESLKTYGRRHRAVRALIRATAAIRDPRLPRALAGLNAPALILWGSRDRLVSRVVITGLEHVLPKAQSHVHLGGGHHLQEDEPEWTAEKLTQFFGEVQD